MRVVRKIGVGIAAAIVTGAVLGLCARVMMRLAAVAAGHEGAPFTLGGTFGIVMIFVVAALPGAVLAALVDRRGRSVLLVVCAVLLCVPATAVAGTDLAGVGPLSATQWVGVGAATAGIYVAILAIPLLTLRLLALERTTRPVVAAASDAPSPV